VTFIRLLVKILYIFDIYIKMNTYKTNYGLITLYKNEVYIGEQFKQGKYWDEKTLLNLKNI
jgi:hypothetical protein